MKKIERDDAEGLINATKAIEKAQNCGVSDRDSIIETYYRIKNMNKAAINKINLKDGIPKLKENIERILAFITEMCQQYEQSYS